MATTPGLAITMGAVTGDGACHFAVRIACDKYAAAAIAFLRDSLATRKILHYIEARAHSPLPAILHSQSTPRCWEVPLPCQAASESAQRSIGGGAHLQIGGGGTGGG